MSEDGVSFFLMRHTIMSRKPATYEDLLVLPEHVVGEIIDGELIVSPRPALEHAATSSELGAELGMAFGRGRGGPGGWWIFDEPELHLGRDVLVPDLAGWRKERVPQRPSGPYATVAPDWVCEVLSPSTVRVDRSAKLRIYARERVSYVWLVDPLQRTLEVLQLDAGGWRPLGTHAGDEKARAKPFDAIELELAILWPEAPAEPAKAP